jgi:hypothetical protein
MNCQPGASRKLRNKSSKYDVEFLEAGEDAPEASELPSRFFAQQCGRETSINRPK